NLEPLQSSRQRYSEGVTVSRLGVVQPQPVPRASAPTRLPTMSTDRPWTTLWDRPNHRVLLLAGREPDQHHWSFVRHDATSSVEHNYDLWRDSEGDIVFVEIHLDE